MTQARRAIGQTEQLREQLSGFSNFTSPVASLYPANTDLSDQLSGLAAMLAAGLPVQVATMSAVGGYDTHENEATTLASNLQRTCDAVLAFQRDLEAGASTTASWSRCGASSGAARRRTAAGPTTEPAASPSSSASTPAAR